MLTISERAESLGTENAFVVLAEIEQLKAQGRNIISFCIGQPDFPTPTHIADAAAKAVREGFTGYTASAGIVQLRRAVADYISHTRSIEVHEDDVVCGSGAKPFIGYSVQAVTDRDRGHEIIYPVPGFPIYESQIIAQGAVPVPMSLRKSCDFHYDLDELSACINEQTRLIILNSPHNPSGVVFSKAYLEKLATIIAPWEKLWVYSDEPYSAFIYDQDFTSIASLDGMLERTIIADSVSKTYSMTGWRVGYGINRKLASVFSRMVTNTDSCAAHPNQYAALAALTSSQDCVEIMRKEFKSRRDSIVQGLNAIDGIECRKPEGAFYAWPDVTELCRTLKLKDSGELAHRLLHEAGVAVLADAHFGTPVKGEGEHLRFSYASSIDQIEEGLTRIKDYIGRLS